MDLIKGEIERKRTDSWRVQAHHQRRRSLVALLGLALVTAGSVMRLATAQKSENTWHAATDRELQALLPARASVGKEHIETETRTASGIADSQGHFIAAVVLITAGYAADGKYSRLLTTQVPLKIGDILLPPGDYVFGWDREADSLDVHFYDASTEQPRGSTQARRIQGNVRVESFKIWPPPLKPRIQIGRFEMPYTVQGK